jgi:plasmid stabilization system protein ParE
MASRVKYLPRAKQDLETIYRGIVQETPLQGLEWFNGLEKSINSLANLSERCPVVPRLSTASDIVRQFLYGNYPHLYKVYYHVAGQTVEIMHIRHGARREASRRDIRT